MKKAPTYYIVAVLVFIANMHIIDPAFGMAQGLPFRSGEKMTFQVKWLAVLAGEATIELLPPEKLNSEDSNHFLFTAHTSEFADMFYKVRDRIESYTDSDMTHSLLYTETRKGKSQKQTVVDFNWEKQEARYSKKGEGKHRNPVSILPGTFDPLAVFYAFRLSDLDKESEIILPATDGKKMVLGKLNIIRKETIKVNGFQYDTFLVEPELGALGGVFEKSEGAKLQIWVTADNRRIPVRMKSKVAVGSFVAELTSYYEGDGREDTDSGAIRSKESLSGGMEPEAKE
jgi:hypothetical protein